ncbi:MAG: iron dependent repressor, metal binding and dimerization domain protein [Candidatus Limiplasma sp.]|nr:iron dependent repressor, metal binding and dimerization domain protein [Candidatus Limiplasma sp.]
MNIFRELLRFVEEVPVGELLKAENEFFETALEIRGKLGKRAYLIDHYLSKAFSVLNAKMTADMVEAGIRAYGEPIHAIHQVEDDENKELFSQAQGTKQTYRHYDSILLTEKGKEKGAYLLKRHDIVERFLGFIGNPNPLEGTELVEHWLESDTALRLKVLLEFFMQDDEVKKRYKPSGKRPGARKARS